MTTNLMMHRSRTTFGDDGGDGGNNDGDVDDVGYAPEEDEEQEVEDLGSPPSPIRMGDLIESRMQASPQASQAPQPTLQTHPYQLQTNQVRTPQPIPYHPSVPMYSTMNVGPPISYPHLNNLSSLQRSRASSRASSETAVHLNPQKYIRLAEKHRRRQQQQQQEALRRQRRRHPTKATRSKKQQVRSPHVGVIVDLVGDDTADESDIASEAAAYAYQSRSRSSTDDSYQTTVADDIQTVHDARDLARSKGAVVGLCKHLSEFDFVCPHCLRDPYEQRTESTVEFVCCARRAHYACLCRIPDLHQLAKAKVPACIQCLRPEDLPPFDAVLQRYHNNNGTGDQNGQAKHQDNGGDGGGGGNEGSSRTRERLVEIWKAYNALGAHLKEKGMVKGISAFLRSEDRTRLPEMDWETAVETGINIRTLFAAGWSLKTIMDEFCLPDLQHPDWQDKLQFDRNALLEMRHSDMLHLVSRYNLHPFELRRQYRIRLQHLWASAESRRNTQSRGSRGSRNKSPPPNDPLPQKTSGLDYYLEGHTLSPAQLESEVQRRFRNEQRAAQGLRIDAKDRTYQTTEQICRHLGVLSPKQLATLGFDLHHMIIMGFSKNHFLNFPWFSLDDWLTELGFRRPHWAILRLTRQDLEPGGLLHGLVGWRLETLMHRWHLQPNDLLDMGVVDSRQLQQLLTPATPSLPPPFHVAANPRMIYAHQQQQYHRWQEEQRQRHQQQQPAHWHNRRQPSYPTPPPPRGRRYAGGYGRVYTGMRPRGNTGPSLPPHRRNPYGL